MDDFGRREKFIESLEKCFQIPGMKNMNKSTKEIIGNLE